MKKTLVAVSLLAAMGAAAAQTSVTLGGTLAAGFQRDGANTSLGLTDYTVTFKGTEQLGGGLSASFGIEFDSQNSSFRQLNCGVAAPTACDKQGIRAKNTSFALNGSFGSLTFANTRGSETGAMALVAPTNLNADFYSSGVISRPAIDFLGYSRTMGGLTLGVSYTESGYGEGLLNNSNGTADPTLLGNGNTNKTYTLSGRYASGPLALAAAYKSTTPSVSALVGPTNVRKGNYEFGGTYDFGVAKFGFGYDSKPAVPSGNDNAATLFGLSFPMGATEIGVNYGKRGTAKFMEAGLKYNLSARTNFNFSVGSYGAATTTGQYRVSLNHAF